MLFPLALYVGIKPKTNTAPRNNTNVSPQLSENSTSEAEYDVSPAEVVISVVDPVDNVEDEDQEEPPMNVEYNESEQEEEIQEYEEEDDTVGIVCQLQARRGTSNVIGRGGTTRRGTFEKIEEE